MVLNMIERSMNTGGKARRSPDINPIYFFASYCMQSTAAG
jgi:hypothetical protein